MRSRRALERPKPSLLVLDLSSAPHLRVLVADVSVERLGKILFQLVDPNELDHVGEVPQPMGSGHPRGQLELDQALEREQSKALAPDRCHGRIRLSAGKDEAAGTTRFALPKAGAVRVIIQPAVLFNIVVLGLLIYLNLPPLDSPGGQGAPYHYRP